MRTLFAFLILLVFIACNQPAEPPTADEPQAAQVEGQPIAESGEALGATIVAPTVYASYYLVRGAGAITTTGALFFQTTAWQMPQAGQTEDVTKYLRDLQAALEKEGILAGVDLTKTKSNWLVVLWPGSSPRRNWVLDSRDLPQLPK